MEAFEDPEHEGNSARHRTGNVCIRGECTKMAGTAWSPYWCFEHNVERMHSIGYQLLQVVKRAAEKDTHDNG